jgi:holo-[acyl-carrier protein] synthase
MMPALALPAGSVAGVGIDLLHIDRIEAAHRRYGDRLLNRILGPREREVHAQRSVRSARRGLAFLATRFAAKEAFSKAIGLGMHMPMAWSRVQVLNRSGGAPYLLLHAELQDWFDQRFAAAHVTLTDELDMVAALVIVERKIHAA